MPTEGEIGEVDRYVARVALHQSPQLRSSSLGNDNYWTNGSMCIVHDLRRIFEMALQELLRGFTASMRFCLNTFDFSLNGPQV